MKNEDFKFIFDAEKNPLQLSFDPVPIDELDKLFEDINPIQKAIQEYNENIHKKIKEYARECRKNGDYFVGVKVHYHPYGIFINDVDTDTIKSELSLCCVKTLKQALDLSKDGWMIIDTQESFK